MMNEVSTTSNMDNVLWRVLRAHVLLLVITVMYIVACVVLTGIYKVKIHLIYNSCKFFFAITALYFSTYSIYCIAIFRPHRPLSFLWDRVRSASTERRVSFVLVVAIVAVHMVAFKYIKPLIPLMHPFAWDAQFAHWDTLLHGADPWRLIHPYLAGPIVTWILANIYVSYFSVVFAAVSWQAAGRNDSNLRMQFLLTFLLCWVLLGTVAATIFSSAGPCFYHHIVPGPDKYVELMSYLQSPTTPASTIILTQKHLWYFYENHEYDHLFSISAMPSMHVALTFLLVLVARRRITRVLSIIFTILIALGCIQFAWHYAIDIYAGIIGTWLIWWIVGLCLRRRLPFSGWRNKNTL